MKPDVELLGMKELSKKFRELAGTPDSRKMNKIILDSAEYVRDTVKSNIKRFVKRRTGLLEQSPIAKKIRRKRKGENSAFVRIDRYLKGTYNGKPVIPNKYAHLVEFGTRGKQGIGFFRKAADSSGPRAERTIKIGVLKIIRDIEKKRAIKAVRA